ncbi:pitrilysin family protein [Kordiimonas sp. SCSIO 12610]|uniref:M16 family metallopeptidase n=1 Tax=Kordiimonas sp. SCSIO 12610 TaxID=2829597 RepID=UPI00210EB16C|nr:pitrilysin family protein [Kordiimonas sp. SCSIO 12610]UTW54000.1 insulinase family protein [Kordiimonas sp. SCSIO 12610]
MKIKFIAAASVLALCTACGEQSAPTEQENEAAVQAITDAASEIAIEYEKFTLSNGLEVVLHVDRSDPIVAFTTVVHAGSNREKVGRTGFAHFFEHMAFNDSENVPRGWNRKAIPDWGGQRNGGTWSDGTIYYEVVPKDAFDKIMWIDSDRLGYMINTVTTAALEREKQVVKNEKRQRVDNAPYGYTQEVIRKALYPEGHPYNWTVIGSLPDLQAATLEDLREFYDQYYGAGNATLAIVGDIDIEETKAKVERWFGEIRKGPDVEPLPAMPIELSTDKSLYFEDNFAKLPELRITFPSVEGYHEDEVALNVLAQLIAGSKNSVLYKKIVETEKLAPGVSAFNNSMEIAGEFVFRVRGNAGTDLDSVYNALNAALVDFETNGVDKRDLARIKAEQENALYGGIATVLGKANQMASDNEFAGDPAYAIKAAAKINALTANEIVRVYEKYIKGKPSIITSFVPKGQSDLSVEGAELATVWIEEVKVGAANEEVSQGAEAEYAKTPSKYDRSEPPFGELPLVKMPDVWEAALPNNVRLLGIENNEVPLVNYELVIEGGGMFDPLEKKGLSSMLAGLMNEGTANRTAAELEQAIGLLGAGINVSAGQEEIVISVSTLAKNFEATVDLVHEILMSPRFDVDGFNRVKSATLTSVKGREAQPRAIAALNFRKLVYGDQHPLGFAQNGTVETVSSIELGDVEALHKSIFAMPASINIAGDIDNERAAKALTKLAEAFIGDRIDTPKYNIPDQSLNAGKVFFIDVPGSKQSVLNIGRLTVSSLDSDANKLDFTNEKLGGGISGDLAQTLRIEKGYTYGAFSSVLSGKVQQPFVASTSVRANATKASLEIIRDMIAGYGRDYSEEGVQTTKQKLVKENTRAFESLRAKLGTLRNISKYGKSKKYVEEDQQELLAMTLNDFKATADRYLVEEQMIYLVVGDKATQFGPVNEFAGGNVVELDIYGNVIE